LPCTSSPWTSTPSRPRPAASSRRCDRTSSSSSPSPGPRTRVSGTAIPPATSAGSRSTWCGSSGWRSPAGRSACRCGTPPPQLSRAPSDCACEPGPAHRPPRSPPGTAPAGSARAPSGRAAAAPTLTPGTEPAHPSQEEAKQRVSAFAADLGAPRRGFLAKLRRRKPEPARGIYLDGGFGVGKTHLLTSLFHAVEGDRVYGTFVEYTDLVGALGFQRAVDLLGESVLVCIDEFELDVPGDTLLMTRLIRELSDRGVAIVATSNTLPDALGEGRFAAQDFLREIQAMAERFEVLRIDGEDY